jgi:hypothetical protein
MFANLTPARLFSNSLGMLDESLHVFDENLHVRERMGSARDGIRSARDAASEFLALHNQGWKAAKVLTLPAALACWLAGWHPGMDAAIGAYAAMVVFETAVHRPVPALPEGRVSVPPQVNFYGSSAATRTAWGD